MSDEEKTLINTYQNSFLKDTEEKVPFSLEVSQTWQASRKRVQFVDQKCGGLIYSEATLFNNQLVERVKPKVVTYPKIREKHGSKVFISCFKGSKQVFIQSN